MDPQTAFGIQPGDAILAIDGHYLYTIDELRAELLPHEPGTRQKIQYRHDRFVSENYLALGKPE
jgi:PDZ domain-containing secreted protein